MSRLQLESQYLKLLSVFGTHRQRVTLSEVSSVLFCSDRHTRNVIKELKNQGWIEWTAQHGRGKKSELKLRHNDFEFNELRVDKLINQGRVSDAIALVHEDEKSLEQFLSNRFGHEIRNDKRSLRVPYYRSMPNLYPCTDLRRSENHLIRQIFNGLTIYNEEKEEVEGDLAFNWKQLDEVTWKFYLRPAVYFHNGKQLDSQDVVASLLRCCKRSKLFQHIVKVKATDSLSVIISLSHSDAHLPLLLTDVKAMILPANHLAMRNFARYPIGTGAYRVKSNDELHLQLQAFDRYFGYRSLIDEVDIVTIPSDGYHFVPISTDYFSRTGDGVLSGWVNNSLENNTGENFQETLIEQGAYFLIYDSRCSELEDVEVRNWFNYVFQDCFLLGNFPEIERQYWIPAKSFMPDYWHTHFDCQRVKPDKQRFTLAYSLDHPEYRMFAQAMKTICSQHNISLQLEEIEYSQWALGDFEADMWLGSVMFSTPKLWSCAKWLFDTQVVRKSLSGKSEDLIDDLLIRWQTGQISDERVIATCLDFGRIKPLFHHWLKLNCSPRAKGVKLNSLGWFDFKSVWLAE